MLRALVEFRIRGVKTNIPFLLKLLTHETFIDGKCWTTFIDDTPSLFNLIGSQNRAQKLLAYLGELAVNGSQVKGQIGEPKFKGQIIIPTLHDKEGNKVDVSQPCQKGWRNVLLKEGPEGFAKAVRANKGCLIMDTTWRDAHQSLLATRVRTVDLLGIAKETSHAYSNAWALECWGGATFDVAMRFLYEDPWARLRKMRQLVPNIPFQMLLRGANGVAYSSLPDNAIYHFCEQAKKNGVDIFRVFDALNDTDQLEVGVKAVLKAGGVAEGTVCYSGDMLNPKKKYNLEYYLAVVEKIVNMGAHILGIKDMAGVLKPRAATMLIGAIRKKYPDLPIHVHTHDSAGTGVASMVACAEAGADAVDAAIDSMSGMTSQPSIGAILASLEGGDCDPGLDSHMIRTSTATGRNSAFSTPPSKPDSPGPTPKSTSTRSPAASSPTSFSKPRSKVSASNGPKRRRPTSRPTTYSATSSRSRLRRRLWVIWRSSWCPTTCRTTTCSRKPNNSTSRPRCSNSSKASWASPMAASPSRCARTPSATVARWISDRACTSNPSTSQRSSRISRPSGAMLPNAM
jgi:pyruvate carboxylase